VTPEARVRVIRVSVRVRRVRDSVRRAGVIGQGG